MNDDGTVGVCLIHGTAITNNPLQSSAIHIPSSFCHSYTVPSLINVPILYILSLHKTTIQQYMKNIFHMKQVCFKFPSVTRSGNNRALTKVT